METQVISPKIKSYQIHQYELWYNEILTNGAVVIKNILNKEQVDKAHDAFWQWLENLGSGIKRGQPSTWKNQNWPGINDMGFFVSYGGCHTKTSWMIRTHPKVKEVFSKIWKTQKLITSFDTIISWRPWWNSPSKQSWDPYVQNLHLDQNPYFKKGLQCVQGMLPLKRIRQQQVGGLMIVPKSNNQQSQQQIIKRYPWVSSSGSDWVQFSSKDPLMGKGKIVQCDAGDLILWDSRTVHGGKIQQPNQQFKKANKNELVRLAVTVTMVPRQWCSSEKQQLRKQYFENHIGTTHWPHQALKNGMGKMARGIDRTKITYKFPLQTKQISDLI